MTQRTIPATYMRVGTSKGVFFRVDALPGPGPARGAILLRVIGSPDPYGKQTDGMGAATSSISKVVIISPSTQPDCDNDYLFGQVSIDAPLIDWTGAHGDRRNRLRGRGRDSEYACRAACGKDWLAKQPLRLGHASGTLAVGAEAAQKSGRWIVSKASVSRSARRLMIGEVLVPERIFTR